MVYSRLASVRETKAVLEDFGLYTKHHLGQNFLISDDVIGKILELAELGPQDAVFEVGPGIGTLTVGMLRLAGAVVSVEADRTLEPVLAETCAMDSERFSLVMGDALKVAPQQLGEALVSLGREAVPVMPNKFVSNLPYQVAATLILKSFQEMASLERAVVMVQAEVADRIAARPGVKAYGAYTAKLALWGEVTGRFEVGPHNFMPPPHVDSAVVRIERKVACDPDTQEPLTKAQIMAASEVIDAAFAQRRKTIRNSMSGSGFEKGLLDEAFARTGILPTARAEALDPASFVRLAKALGRFGEGD